MDEAADSTSCPTRKLERYRYIILALFVEPELVGVLTITDVMLSGSSRSQIGDFSTTFQGDQHIHQNETNILSHLPRAVRAAHNSSSSDDVDVASTCLADTRVAVLKEIEAWVYGHDKRCIFWLNGVAGIGKSTIARTICHDFSEKGHLGASFFFSRDEQDRSHADLLFTTIGWQLSRGRGPAVQKAFVETVRARPDIAELRSKEQWESLVLKPLKQQRGDIVAIVIDALDECEKSYEVRNLISLLMSAASVKQCRLRTSITSRPEATLRTSFASFEILHRPLELHNVPDEVVDGDICLFLYDELNRAKEQHELSAAAWPDVDTVNQLVVQSNRLFIYAATLCKFVSRYTSYTPDKAVQHFMYSRQDVGKSSAEVSKTAQLDELYRGILRYAVEVPDGSDKSSKKVDRLLCKKVMQVLGYITTLRDPLSVPVLASLVGMDADEIRHLLKHTHSVLRVPKDPVRPVKLYHPSFREFLHDRKRCGEGFCVDTGTINGTLTEKMLDFMSGSRGFRRDCLDKNAPGILRSEVTDSEVVNKMDGSLAYASCHWVHHLAASSIRLQDGDCVHRFLQTHFLHWIETLSWLGRLSESISQINILLLLAEGAASSVHVSALLHDAKRFMLRYREMIDQAPLQIYASALVFAPPRGV